MVTFTGHDVRATLSHSTHEHGLKLVAMDKLFQCDGCRQIGDELRFRCEQCDFDLHICCDLSPTRVEPSMFEGRALTLFQSRPASANNPGGVIPICDVCGDPVCGFLYHNREHDLDLHPMCAFLPKRVRVEEHELELHQAAGHNCGLCGKDGYLGKYMAYRFQDDDGQLAYVHVVCLMEASYSSDGHVVQGTSTTTGELATLQNAPRRSGGFRRFCKVAFRIVRVSYSVATLDPVGVFTAIAS